MPEVINARLDTIIKLVRSGSFVADIGADHAYVAIEAVRSGLCSGALATDLREGPLSRAAENIARAGLAEKIFTMKTNGLTGIEAYKPTDIVIAGMGGELIADILKKAPYSKTLGLNLVLQPMTSAYDLRKYLYSEGFDIKRELLAREDDRFYQIISATYTGAVYVPAEIELHLGAYNIARHEDKELFRAFVSKEAAKYAEIYSGKLKAGIDTQYERSLLFLMQKILDDNK